MKAGEAKAETVCSREASLEKECRKTIRAPLRDSPPERERYQSERTLVSTGPPAFVAFLVSPKLSSRRCARYQRMNTSSRFKLPSLTCLSFLTQNPDSPGIQAPGAAAVAILESQEFQEVNSGLREMKATHQ